MLNLINRRFAATHLRGRYCRIRTVGGNLVRDRLEDVRVTFIGSAPSSGSSLLAGLVSKFPDTCWKGELALFDKVELWRMPSNRYETACRRALAGHYYPSPLGGEMDRFLTGPHRWDLTPQHISDLAAGSHSHARFTARVVNDRLQHFGNTAWLEKTPGNVYSFPEIAAAFPEARLIAITRSATTTITSLIRRGFAPIHAVAKWYIPTLLATCGDASNVSHTVSYEQLVKRPRMVLEGIAEYLNLPYTDAIDSAIHQGSAADMANVSTWTRSLDMPVTPDASHPQVELAPVVRDVFHRLRPSRHFVRRHGLKNWPSPFELQELLGHSTAELTQPHGRSRSLPITLSNDNRTAAIQAVRRRYFPRPPLVRLV